MLFKNNLKKLLYLFYYLYGNKHAIKKLKKECKKCDSISDLVDLAFNFKWGLKRFNIDIRPSQEKSEIIELLHLLKKHKPKYILEIGTERGGTLFLFSNVAYPQSMIISIDLPGGPFGKGYPFYKIPIFKSFGNNNKKIFLLRMNFHNIKTLERVKKILGSKKIDFLFIDGDHRYDGVKKDFIYYSPLVRKGGIIAFHDIVPSMYKKVGGVPLFWKEVKKNYNNTKEIVNNWGQEGRGIGIIIK